MARKRMKYTYPEWSGLHLDLLDLVLNKLPLVNKLCLRGVCTTWRSIAKTHISKLYQINMCPKSPMLMLPNNQNYGYDEFEMSCNNQKSGSEEKESETRHFCGRSLVKLENNKLEKVKNIPEDIGQRRCFGSSAGWLVFFDECEKKYSLFNPLYDIRISLGTLPELEDVKKIIIWSNPIVSCNKYGVVTIYGHSSSIAYAMCGDDNWSYLDGKGYSDVICGRSNIVYAIDGNCFLHSWYLNSSNELRKISLLSPSFDLETVDIMNRYHELPSWKVYLVESQGEMVLIERYIWEYVRIRDCEVIDEIGTLDNENGPWTYMTKIFHVYRLDINQNKWLKTDNLGNGAIVLGGNNSVSVLDKLNEGFEKDSIYFSDDYWDHIDLHKDEEDCSYGGHDVGVFNLKDDSVKYIYGVDDITIRPTPFWVVP